MDHERVSNYCGFYKGNNGYLSYLVVLLETRVHSLDHHPKNLRDYFDISSLLTVLVPNIPARTNFELRMGKNFKKFQYRSSSIVLTTISNAVLHTIVIFMDHTTVMKEKKKIF